MMISPFQYLISNVSFDTPMKNGILFSQNGLHIQIHSSNKENLVCHKNGILFGECFDFENPTFSHEDIVRSLTSLPFEDKIKQINKLSGLFIIILFEGDSTFIFNDTAGQLEVFIYNESDRLLISSLPNFILPFMEDEIVYDSEAPQYIIDQKINIFGKTPFQNIEKLVPNFYYDISNKRSTRFFPKHPLPIERIAHVAQKANTVLEKIIASMVHRRKLALAITGGWDSRILFAASLKQKKNIDYFVLDLKTKLGDIDTNISKIVADTFSKKLNIIDADLSSIHLNAKEKPTIWKEDLVVQKLGPIMKLKHPDHYHINGTVSEISKNYYDPLPGKLTLSDICHIVGVKNGEYEIKAVKKWLETTNKNLHILDYIQWENKMPNWAGSKRSVSNLYITSISPFNNRHLLTLLLSTKRGNRDKYFHNLYKEMLGQVDERFIKIPINPIKKQRGIKWMKKLRIYPLYRYATLKSRTLKL